VGEAQYQTQNQKVVTFFIILLRVIPPIIYVICCRGLSTRQTTTIYEMQIISKCHLTLYQNSFFPATIHLWNNWTQYIRDSPSNCILKSRLKTYYNNPVKPPKYFSFGSRLASILHTRLRQNCSSLKGALFRCNLIDSCYCNCDNYVENNEHYFLHCKLFANQRNVMLNNIRDLGLRYIH
jgi:hypothetical protein